MEENYLVARRKAILLTGGAIKVSTDFRPPFPLSRSTAGPGAGTHSMVFCFDGTRVKKTISTHEGDFELVKSGDRYLIMHNNEILTNNVTFQPTIYHAPEQAFFNLSTNCIYSCKFCTSPRLDKRITKSLDSDRIVDMILTSYHRGGLKAVALTSAVESSPQKTVDRMIEIVKRVRKELPTMPIGVEPYVDCLEQIDSLREAGADEIKLNIETYDREIFDKVCGELDFDWILEAIAYAAKVFGHGKVTSNVILGMGETDEKLLEGIEALAMRGCVATLRPIRLNDMNREAMEEALGRPDPISPDRLLRLARSHKEILKRYDLDTRSINTMCHECGCCDVVPFRDL
ncbi:MAG: radical SAM protein [Euryarchaeota archaeon]|nr:radical SAM protein [Euryarchaeota archaeon]